MKELQTRSAYHFSSSRWAGTEEINKQIQEAVCTKLDEQREEIMSDDDLESRARMNLRAIMSNIEPAQLTVQYMIDQMTYRLCGGYGTPYWAERFERKIKMLWAIHEVQSIITWSIMRSVDLKTLTAARVVSRLKNESGFDFSSAMWTNIIETEINEAVSQRFG